MQWFLICLKKYAVFSGRARRSEYWMFWLFYIIFSIPISWLAVWIKSELLIIAYFIALFIPYLAVSVRRLHDTNRSAWWMLLNLVPFVGSIILIVFFVFDGDKGDNHYGPDPKPFDRDDDKVMPE